MRTPKRRFSAPIRLAAALTTLSLLLSSLPSTAVAAAQAELVVSPVSAWTQHFSANPDVLKALGVDSLFHNHRSDTMAAVLADAPFTPAGITELSPEIQAEIIRAQTLRATNAATRLKELVESERMLLPLLYDERPDKRDKISRALDETRAAIKSARYVNWDADKSPAQGAINEMNQVTDELSPLFHGMRGFAAGGSEHDATFVRNTLLPYAKNALDEAEARVEKRGIERWKASAVLLKENMVSRNSAVLALEDRHWSEFVAGLAMEAAERLGRTVAETPGERRALRALQKSADNADLRVELPTWHPAAGKYASVSDWISLTYGLPAETDQGWGMKLPEIKGIPVVIRPGAFIISALLAMTSLSSGVLPALASPVLLYTSVLLHEFGHALIARRVGLRTKLITLNTLGGAAHFDVPFLQKPRADFLIAFAGPAVNLALAALFGISALFLASHLLMTIAGMNLFIGVFNMLPIVPMDGGRMLYAALLKRLGDPERAARRTIKFTRWAAFTASALFVASLMVSHIPLLSGLPFVWLLALIDVDVLMAAVIGGIGGKIAPSTLSAPPTVKKPETASAAASQNPAEDSLADGFDEKSG